MCDYNIAYIILFYLILLYFVNTFIIFPLIKFVNTENARFLFSLIKYYTNYNIEIIYIIKALILDREWRGIGTPFAITKAEPSAL